MTTRRKGFDADEVHVPSSNDSRPRPDDLVDVLELTKKWRPIRPVGQIFPYGTHWVTTKKRDGGKGAFPTPCLAFDPETGERDSTRHCPWCEFMTNHPGSKENPSLVRFSTDYWMNVIDRRAQEDAPSKMPRLEAEEKESGFKSKDSDSWTPVRAYRLSGQDLRKMRSLRDLNTHKIKGKTEAMSVFHQKYGRDVNACYDKDEKVPANRVKFNLGDHTPLTEEELALLTWDLSSLTETPSEIEAKSEFNRWATRMGVGDGDDEDEDKPKRKSKADALNDKKKASNAALRNALDDDEDEDEDDVPVAKGKKKPVLDDDDEDDEPAPKKGKKPVVVDDDEDEDEDDEPTPKKGKPLAKGKKPVIDDEDEDEDDEDDEPTPKKGKPPAKGKKPVVDDEDEDDEDDEPAPKKAPAKKAVPAKGKKPVVVDDDDEDEDDEEPAPKKGKAPVKGKKPVVVDDDEDEDDEDDEPPSKKAPPKKAAASKGKKTVVDDDDEDF